MGRQIPELTDEDLDRLARLGAGTAQIAEAAGIEVAQVRRRLARGPNPSESEDRRQQRAGSASIC